MARGSAHAHLHRRRARRHARRPRPRRRRAGFRRAGAASSRAAASPALDDIRAVARGRARRGDRRPRAVRGAVRRWPRRWRPPPTRTRPMILRALVVLLARGRRWPRSPTSGSSGPAVAAGCRSPAAPSPGRALGLLLLNVSCPSPGAPRRPLVLLDASLSLSAPGGRWPEARDSAARWGEVRRFGDERGSDDTLPTRGRSLLAPALIAASASDRPVVVVTDGEIEDARRPSAGPAARGRRPALSPERPARPGPHPRDAARRGSPRATRSRSSVEVEAAGGATADSVAVEAMLGGKRLGVADGSALAERQRARPAGARASLGGRPGRARASRVASADAERRGAAHRHAAPPRHRRADARASCCSPRPADWDSRFLYRTLREVAQLPVRGFVRIDPERWRSMADLSRRADRDGAPGGAARRSADRRWDRSARSPKAPPRAASGRWPRGLATRARLPGDWYLTRRPTRRPWPARSWASRWTRSPRRSSSPRCSPRRATGWRSRPSSAGGARRGRRCSAGEDGRVRRVDRGGGRALALGLPRRLERAELPHLGRRHGELAAGRRRLGSRVARGRCAPVVENGRPVVFEWTGPGPPSRARRRLERRRSAAARHAALRRQRAARRSGSARGVPLPTGGRRRRDRGGRGVLGGAAAAAGRARARTRRGRRSRRRGAPRATGSGSSGSASLALAGEWIARRRLGLR